MYIFRELTLISMYSLARMPNIKARILQKIFMKLYMNCNCLCGRNLGHRGELGKINRNNRGFYKKVFKDSKVCHEQISGTADGQRK
jgi:hypothetical protein